MKYIIKGGEFNNKGSEAMSLVAIYNILVRDADAEIYFFNQGGYNVDFTKDLNIKLFEIDYRYFKYLAGKDRLDFDICIIKNIIKRIFRKDGSISLKALPRNYQIISKADFFIDISGYALASVWGEQAVDYYLDWINVISRNNKKCKIVLMPQSYGPVNDNYDKNKIYQAMRKCWKIYAREKDGYDFLLSCGLRNVELCLDSVLIEKKYSPQFVVNNFGSYVKDTVKFDSDSVVIIPNTRLIDKGGINQESLMSVYVSLIDAMKGVNKIVLIPHAGEDIAICKGIKEYYLDDDRVTILDHVPRSFVFEEMISDVKYIIASRYHSIIHAYRKGVPALILGWANKYLELANYFEQERFILDLERDMDYTTYLNDMEVNCELEKEKIMQKYKEITNKGCYGFLDKIK